LNWGRNFDESEEHYSVASFDLKIIVNPVCLKSLKYIVQKIVFVAKVNKCCSTSWLKSDLEDLLFHHQLKILVLHN
jgi:hypothetical protein